MKRIFGLLLAYLCCSTLRAQQMDNPVAIPIHLYAQGVITAPDNNSYFNIGGLGDPIQAHGNGSQAGTTMYTPLQTVNLLPGKEYTVTITAQSIAPVIVYFSQSPGQDIYINKTKRTIYPADGVALQDGADTFTLRIESINDLAQNLADKRGGDSSGLPEDKPIWYVGLGSMRNGAFAGAVGFRASTISSSLFNTGSLIYDSINDAEVHVDRTNGYITKITARSVVLQVDPYNAFGTSYQIKAFTPSNLTTPFITYTVSQYAVSGGNGIRIDKLEDGINWSTALTQVGSTWTRYDWQQIAANSTAFDSSHTAVTNVTSDISGTTENVSYGVGTTTKRKTYAAGEMTSVTMGPAVTPLVTTSYSFYTDTTAGGWPNATKSVIEPTGKWTKYEYYNGGTSSDGQLYRLYHPWLDGPTDPASADLSTSYVETYNYVANYDGNNTAKSNRIVTIAGTQVGKTSWTYNWSYTSANSHTVAKTVQQDYTSSSASSFLTTTTLMFRPDDTDLYFADKLHAVTYPNGRKDSYAYFTGSWNATTRAFSGDATGASAGPDRLVLVFHGQTSGGTTVSSWTNGVTWTMEPVSMVTGVSTVSVSVIDTNGRLVYSAEQVYNAGTFEDISATVYGFDGNNRPSTETDVVRGLTTTHSYTAGTATTTADVASTHTVTQPDGITVLYQFDKFNRLMTTVTGKLDATNLAAYPARINHTVYNAADLPIRSYSLAGASIPSSFSSPVVIDYDVAGRVIYKYEKSPGDVDDDSAGSLVTHYEYPSGTSRKTTNVPTGAWRLDDSYLDGRPKSVTGTAQVPEQWTYDRNATGLITTHQNGSTAVNGFTQDQTDYLGRVITHTTAGYGYDPSAAASNVIDVTSHYDDDAALPTGNLQWQRTTYRATGALLVPDQRYNYDGAGRLTAQGADVDGDGQLMEASNDRYSKFDHAYSRDTAGWRDVVTTSSYGVLNSSSATRVSQTETRLTGFSTGVVGETVSYDTNNNKTVQTTTVDAANVQGTTTTQVTGVANQTYITNTAVQVTKNGYAFESQDFTGHKVRKDYDSLGRLYHIYSRSSGTAFSATDTYNYYLRTGFLSSTTIAGTPISYSYGWNSGNGTRTVMTTDGTGNSSYTRYNAMDLPDRSGGTGVSPVEYGYDAMGRKTRMTTWRSGGPYTEANWPSSQAGGDTTQWTPDPATGLVTRKTYADNSYDDFDYTPAGKIKTKTAAGIGTNNTRYVITYAYYDGSNQSASDVSYRTQELASISYSDGRPGTTFTYKRTGLVDTVNDGSSGLHTFGYGSNPFQLQTETLGDFYGGTSSSTHRVLTRTYDAVARSNGFTLGTSGAPAGDLTQTIGYDPATGRLATLSTKIGSNAPRVYTYSYNQADTSMPTGYSDGGSLVTVIEYDATSATRRTQTQGKGASTVIAQFDVAYDNCGSVQWTKQSGTGFGDYYGGATTNSVYNYNWYDSRHQLNTTAKYRNSPPTNANPASADELPGRRYEYRYDWAGNRLIAGFADPNSSASGIDENYTANTVNQYSSKENKVVHVAGTAAPSANVTVTSASGNPSVTKLDNTFAADLVPSPGTGTLTVSSSVTGSTLSVTRPWVLRPATEALAYDHSGNLTTDAFWNYTYDAESRLVTMIPTSAGISSGLPNQRLDFAYDYLGRRVMKRTSTVGGSGAWVAASERHYLYDGWNLIAEFESLSNMALVRSYTWGLDVTGGFTATAGVGALMQIHDYAGSGADYCPTYDVAGNVAAVLDVSGNIAALYEYSPFGELVRREGSYAKSNAFRYSSRFCDDETGLIYYGNRYYDPARGRFINRDPSGESGGNNLYAFVGNNPVTHVDVLGLGDGDLEGTDHTPFVVNGGDSGKSVFRGTLWDQSSSVPFSFVFSNNPGAPGPGFVSFPRISLTGASLQAPQRPAQPGTPSARALKVQALARLYLMYRQFGGRLGMAQALATMREVAGLPADPDLNNFIANASSSGGTSLLGGLWNLIRGRDTGLHGTFGSKPFYTMDHEPSNLDLNVPYNPKSPLAATFAKLHLVLEYGGAGLYAAWAQRSVSNQLSAASAATRPALELLGRDGLDIGEARAGMTFEDLRAAGYSYTERMSKARFAREFADVPTEGLRNTLIDYVNIEGDNYIVGGNSRLRAGIQYNLTDNLTFREVQLPYRNYETINDVIQASLNYRGR